MAYVAISGEFIERVKAKINTMHRAELAVIGENYPRPKLTVSGGVVQTIWGEHMHLRSVMPEAWMNNYERIDCKIVRDGKSFTFQAEFPGGCTMPPNFTNSGYLTVDESDPELKEVAEYFTKRDEIDSRWVAVTYKVTNYLHSCKSLNEAVKLWPDVAMYVDKRDIDRMGVKHERARESAAMEALKALDTDELVGAAVIARMSGAQV